jgi:hypothetical protein
MRWRAEATYQHVPHTFTGTAKEVVLLAKLVVSDRSALITHTGLI